MFGKIEGYKPLLVGVGRISAPPLSTKKSANLGQSPKVDSQTRSHRNNQQTIGTGSAATKIRIPALVQTGCHCHDLIRIPKYNADLNPKAGHLPPKDI